MTSRYEAKMNDVALSSIDPAIYVLDIRQNPSDIDTVSTAKAAGYGMFVGRRHLEKCSVRIDAEIHKYDISERQEVCQRIKTWAKRGILETNDRPGQYLNVICEDFPTVQSAKHWTDPVTILFTAFEIPYWMEKTASSIAVANSGALYVPGNIDLVPINAEIVSNSALTTLTITAGDTSLTLSGLNIPANTPIIVTHDVHGYLSITNNGDSLLAYRTGDDDLLAACGRNAVVTCNANAAVTCTFSTYGGWY